MLEELIRAWDGEQVVAHFDHPTETWMFICVHSTRRGPAGGGTRMKIYPEPGAALEDAMRLASGMTLKMAAADLPFGGGKAVLAVPALPEGDERRRVLLRYAELVASLGGNYQTGPDMNTTSDDMDVIGEISEHVYCRNVEHGGSGDPGPSTARGVFHGVRASIRHVFGSDELEGRTVLVQGVGDVGARLADQLEEAGATVLVSDVASDRAFEVAARTGGRTVDPERALEVECDVYAPCAHGATLSERTIPSLRCRIVAGSANNQLATPEDAERLREAEILYAPDFVINAGGVLYAWGVETLGWTPEIVEGKLVGLGDTIATILERAEAEGITTEAAAERLALARLG